jgi:hypothetical protein
MPAPTATHARARVQDASALLVGKDAQNAELTLEGSRGALVFYRRDRVECERRRLQAAAPLGAEDLAALLQLPAGMPVRADSLPRPLQDRIARLPHGAVAVDGGIVQRLAVRPLAIDLVVVRARGTHWDDGLARASRFKPFARRALLVDPPASQREDLLMQAAYYGIGILQPAPDGLTWALLPEPYRPRRHTPAAWHFTERLHTRLP